MRFVRRLYVPILVFLIATQTVAQVPGAASLPNAPPALDQQQPLELKQLSPSSTTSSDAKQVGKTYRIRRFDFTGVTLVPEIELQQAVQPYQDHELSADQLQFAATAVVKAYVIKGWLARVGIIPTADGYAEVKVQELRFGQMRVDAPTGNRASPALAETYIGNRQTSGAPLSVADVERGTTLLNATPGIAAATALDPGQTPDKVDLVVRLRDRPMLSGQVFTDNHGLREIGQARVGADLQFSNGLGFGDQANLTFRASQFSNLKRGSFSLPVGNDGLRAGISAYHFEYRAGRVGASLGLQGTIANWRGFIAKPLLIQTNHTLLGSLAYEESRLRDDSDFGELDKRQVSRWRISLNDNTSDARTLTHIAIQVTTGKADLSENAGDLAADAASTRTHGHFALVGWHLGREQRLDGGDILVTKLNGQMASRNLESSHKFSLGGPNGVRAYPVAEALGDEGWLASIERRTALADSAQAGLFLDTGHIRINHRAWGNGRNHYSLAGLGASIRWLLPDSYHLKAEAAHQIGLNPNRNASNNDSDGRTNRWRFWLSLAKSF